MSHFEAVSRPTVGDRKMKSMKRTLGLTFAGLAAAALFAGLVHGALVAAGVAEPAATTVYGMTSRRVWATTAGALALVGVLVGGMALVRSMHRVGNGGRRGATVALVAGPVAAVNGALVLTLATRGPRPGHRGLRGARGAGAGAIRTAPRAPA